MVPLVSRRLLEASSEALFDVGAAFTLWEELVVEVVHFTFETVNFRLLFSTSMRPAEVEELGYRRGKLPQLEVPSHESFRPPVEVLFSSRANVQAGHILPARIPARSPRTPA